MNNTYDSQYKDILFEILKEGDKKFDKSRSTKTLSIFGTQIKVNVQDSFPLLSLRKIYFKSIVAELLWFLKGDTHISTLESKIWDKDAYRLSCKIMGNDYLSFDKFKLLARKQKGTDPNTDHYIIGDCGPIYGKQWRDFNGIDQLVNAIQKLKDDFQSRQNVTIAWNPNDLSKMALPPCHLGFILNGYIHPHTGDKSLRLNYWMRSNDFFLGQPFNTASYALLLHIISDMLNVKATQVVGQLADTHLYENQIEGAIELTKQELNSSDKLPILSKSTHYWELVNNYREGNLTISQFMESLDITMFEIKNYFPQTSIKVEMLAKNI